MTDSVGGKTRREEKRPIVHPWLKLLLCAILAAAVHCAGPMPYGHACRTVHVKVLVDPDLAPNASWKTAVLDLFDKSSRTMQAWTNVTLQVDTMGLWDIEKAPSYKDLLLGDCLIKEQPKGNHDILVYIGTTGSQPNITAAMTLYELGYAFIQQPAEFNAKAIDPKTFQSLVHWLAHMFGAVHCYFDKNNITIMNPFIHDGTMLDVNDDCMGMEPKIHRGNEQIMRALAKRPFVERTWEARRWGPIRRTYEQVRREYNPWRIDEYGEVANYRSDAFHEGNLFLYLSSWASLCGMPNRALEYLDSADQLGLAMKKTCIKEGIAGTTRLCSICGYDTTSIITWFETRKFNLEMRRSMIYLRAGAISRADSSFDIAMARIPPQLAILKDKYANGHAFYKTRYAGKADTPAAPQSAK